MQRPNDEIYRLRAQCERWPADKPLAGREFSREVFLETDVVEASLAWRRGAVENPRGAIIICPGGGYEVLATAHEGNNVADWLNAHGFAAFVLRYRVPQPGAPAPLEDIRSALRLVRERADYFGVPRDRVGVLGFSAGGHLAGCAALMVPPDDKIERPDFLAMIYPVVSMCEAWAHRGSVDTLLGHKRDSSLGEHYSLERQVADCAPPLFLVHARDDALVPVENSLALQASYRGVEAECTTYFPAEGGHGFGLGRTGTEAGDWPRRLLLWLNARCSAVAKV
ncbi:hypothetical protein CMV30_16570 [Nibricoccus aquaticus]|uniref:BD-FAE-like domain-containing protein n=1 Tax=Nibricoccus aquaticus TaxID=2576891 RepID=A0A290QJB7_9BACT|nr:alpha/beta hydrolase [Nibricoccus aquaticus]ATC65428.1 hypothetical protein CMV30_16570 [Nibricoccus aquaticus]